MLQFPEWVCWGSWSWVSICDGKNFPGDLHHTQAPGVIVPPTRLTETLQLNWAQGNLCMWIPFSYKRFQNFLCVYVCMQCVCICVYVGVCVYILAWMWIQILCSPFLHIQFHLFLFFKLMFCIGSAHYFQAIVHSHVFGVWSLPKGNFPASWISNRCWMWGC